MPPLPTRLRPGGRFPSWDPATPEYVVLDVDGTLVGAEPAASEVVADAVARAQTAGLRLGFATGRMRLAVEPLWAQLRTAGPHVLHNGAEVRLAGRTVASWPLQPDHLRAIADVATRLDAYAEVYVPDGFLVSRWDERARPHWRALGREPLGVLEDPGAVEAEVLKVTFALFDGQSATPLVEALTDAGLAAGPAGSPLTPGLTYVNATHPDADKGAAVRAAAAAIDVPVTAVVAIGDAANDLPMLQLAGTAIAMGQAEEAVVAAAHLIAPRVDEDGVAVALDAVAALHAGATTVRGRGRDVGGRCTR